MPYLQKIFPNTYRDSVALMQISTRLMALQGVNLISLVMATAANLELLREAGLIESLPKAGVNDLLFAAEGDSEQDLKAAIIEAEINLNTPPSRLLEVEVLHQQARTIEMALGNSPDANFVLISCPGNYAAAEAMKALNLGLDVMLFSDNVPMDHEIALKKIAKTKNLLLMGPDCGTAILNGVPLGFANKVRRGDIGIIAASGTGLQQVSCLIDRWGGGISQAIGTGGRDLHAQVGGSTTIAAIEALTADVETKVIVLISKPPSPDVADIVLKKAAASGKPVVVNFPGTTVELPDSLSMELANDLEAAAYAAVLLAGIDVVAPARHLVTPKEVSDIASSLSGTQRYVRGLYSGGTFSYEAMNILGEMLGPIHSGTPLEPKHKLYDPWQSIAHTVVDLGDDLFTRGRPHPMIDHRLRNERIIQEAKDPQTAIILIDVVLGYGSHENPAGEMMQSITEARKLAGVHEPVFVGFVCGTVNDPQILSKQEEILSEVGVLLMESNAQAARLAGDIILMLDTGSGKIA